MTRDANVDPTRDASTDEAWAAELEKRRLLNRLKRLEGQVRGLQRMVEEERSCREILTLLSGVRSALDAAGDQVLESYLVKCRADLTSDAMNVEELVLAVKLARG